MPRRHGNVGEVSVFEVITSYSDISPTQLLVATACVVAVADVGCAIALYGVIHGWAARSWWPLVILKNTWDTESFYRDSADILLLVIARLSIVPAIAFIAATIGKPPEATPSQDASADGAGGQQEGVEHETGVTGRRWCWWRWCRPQRPRLNGRSRRQRGLLDLNELEGGRSREGDDSFYVPLLAAEERSGETDRTSGSAAPSSAEHNGPGGDGAMKVQQSAADAAAASAAAEKALETLKARASVRKNVLLVLLFVVSTTMQVYTGVKCVGFRFTREPVEGPLMGLGVLWLNALMWVLTQMVADATQEEGILEPSLHPHRLYPETERAHVCDMCRVRMKTGRGKSWRCKLCDFDLCRSCYEKKDRRGAEEVLRGDKGVREENRLQTMGYFRKALGLARPHWPYFSLAFACLAVSKAASIALPNFTGGVIDRVFRHDVEGFKRYIILFLALSVVKTTIGGVQALSFRLAGLRMGIGARKKLFRGVISQDVAFFEGTTSGKLISRLTSDVQAMVAPCTYMLGNLFSNTILLGGGVVMCFLTSWRLSMLAFTTVGPVYHITQLYARWSQKVNVAIYAALAESSGYATEALGNVRTVKAMSTEVQEMAKFDKSVDMALEKGIKDSFGSAITGALSGYLDLGASSLILWYGGSLAMDGEDRMTAGELITYQLYWNMINTAWKGLLSLISSLTRAAGAAERVFSLMDSLPDIDINSGLIIDDKDFRGEISIQELEFTYQMRPDNQVLKSVDLHIPAGTTCALVGRSGSGKTTLVHLLLRFYDPWGGRILVDGIPLTDLQLRSLHRKMAIVAQDTQLFATSIFENITYGLEEWEYTAEDVYEAAKQACAHDFITGFSDGYETKVGERGTRLSGGQKQRVAIARALLRKPRILLLDEATSALDAESEASVQKALDNLVEKGAGSTTVVLVAHRLSTVMNAQNIAVMDKGVCIEQGTHDKLMQTGGVYSSLVARQISRAANTLQQEGEGEGGGVADIDTLMDELDGRGDGNGKGARREHSRVPRRGRGGNRGMGGDRGGQPWRRRLGRGDGEED